MDSKTRQNAPKTTVTVNRKLIAAPTGNIYLAIEIIAKRAEQIQQELAKEFKEKAQPFHDEKETLQEVFENQELIDISRYYEKLPKPWALALQEWIEGKIVWKFADEEDDKNQK
jgi:DNA-directed RNA polymerase subunit K/omega